MSTYKLSDNVIARIAQIVQEALLLGIDVVDLMRQIEVHPASNGTDLDLTETYVKHVSDTHKKLLLEAEELQRNKNDVFKS